MPRKKLIVGFFTDSKKNRIPIFNPEAGEEEIQKKLDALAVKPSQVEAKIKPLSNKRTQDVREMEKQLSQLGLEILELRKKPKKTKDDKAKLWRLLIKRNQLQRKMFRKMLRQEDLAALLKGIVRGYSRLQNAPQATAKLKYDKGTGQFTLVIPQRYFVGDKLRQRVYSFNIEPVLSESKKTIRGLKVHSNRTDIKEAERIVGIDFSKLKPLQRVPKNQQPTTVAPSPKEAPAWKKKLLRDFAGEVPSGYRGDFTDWYVDNAILLKKLFPNL